MRASSTAVGVGSGLIGALLLAPAASSALDSLAVARGERETLRAEVAAPAELQPPLSPGLALPANTQADARKQLAARVQSLAKVGSVLIEDASASQAPGGVAGLRLRVSGTEKAVLAFADALERETPVMRLRSWEIAALPGGNVRLSGELVAGWR